MNTSRLVWGVICLVLAAALGVLCIVLPPQNLMFALDRHGLRDKITPLIGFEYAF